MNDEYFLPSLFGNCKHYYKTTDLSRAAEPQNIIFVKDCITIKKEHLNI